MNRLGIAALLLLAACGPEWTNGRRAITQPRSLHVCAKVPYEHMPAVEEAVAEWAHALEGWRQIELSDSSCDITIEQVPADAYPGTWIGEANELGGNIVRLRAGAYERRATDVVSHELGHIFGAQHVPSGLMASDLDRVPRACPDSTTMAQVAAYQRISLEILKWCY